MELHYMAKTICPRPSKHLGRKALPMIVAISVMALPTAAQAGTLWCTTTVSGVGVSPGGIVVPTLDGMGTPYMCNLTTPMASSWGSIPTSTCQAWVSMFITAKTSGQKITLAFDYGAAAAPASCAAIPNFSWQVPPVFPYWFNFAG
jgi:hypothetical protein